MFDASDLVYESIQCRSVFMSDIHLGSAGCKAEAVDQFLNAVKCENLYLVGDILDGWVGARDGKWKQAHANVVRTILGMTKNGTSVYYSPGNHDSFLRRLNGGELGNTLVDHSFDHLTPGGEKFLVVHGDLFDKTVTKYHPIAYIFAWGYELISILNNNVNSRRLRKELNPVDFCSVVKRVVKLFVSQSTSYEEELVAYAKSLGYSGVISGHVHRPRISSADGFIYANAGDWVENCTAILEHFDGSFELVWWRDLKSKIGHPPDSVAETDRLMRL